MKISTGKGTITLPVLLAIWSVSAVTSLPGLAVSPILGDLKTIFPAASDLEIQMLTSLPSLLIIPFVLLSGKLAVGRRKLRILVIGLTIFLLSGIACLFIRDIVPLIFVSCILGIGAGMVIPLSTGLVATYFTGVRRVRQLGYSSAINNLTLVAATAFSGYLATIDWHLSFLVYTLPVVSLLLTPFLFRQPAAPEPAASDQMRRKTIDRRGLVRLTVLYFFITYAALTITFYAPFLIDDDHLPETFSGILISLFFLAIMAPGLLLDRIIAIARGRTNFVALVLMSAGLSCFGFFDGRAPMIAGALLTGFGYGVMQPIIYDKTAVIAPPRSATLALSFVMAANYLAIMLCPFIVDSIFRLTSLHGDRIPFLFNGLSVAALALYALVRRDDPALGLDSSYYERRA